MFQGKRIGAVILIGGSGERFGSQMPKQFLNLGGKPIYLHTLEKFLESKLFDDIVLVCHPNWVDEVQGRATHGGKTRQESSRNGILALHNVDIVVIHDGVRPFITKRILEENISGAIQWGAVDTCIPSADTLVYAPEGKKIESIPERKAFLRGQTPQSFRKDLILQAHEKALADGIFNATDDCQLVLRTGADVGIVYGDETNLKITTEFDLALAEQILQTSLIK